MGPRSPLCTRPLGRSDSFSRGPPLWLPRWTCVNLCQLHVPASLQSLPHSEDSEAWANQIDGAFYREHAGCVVNVVIDFIHTTLVGERFSFFSLLMAC